MSNTLQHNDSTYKVNEDGYVLDNEDGIILTAKQLDQLMAASLAMRKREAVAKKIKIPATPEVSENGFDIHVEEDEDGCVLTGGDIAVGCTTVEFDVLQKAHRLSVAARKKRKKA